MSHSLIIGDSGRLGRVVGATLRARGDVFGVPSPVNYLVFTHRYRGSDPTVEFNVNVGMVASVIDSTAWLPGDCAIVIVSSINATRPTLTQSMAYNVSKAAQCQLARYYALKGTVRCNTVSPNTFTGPDAVVTPQQVADVIAFLCSPQASGINGQDIRITG